MFTPDDFWRIFNLLKDGTMDPALDTNTKILAGSEQSISEKLFSNNIDQNAHLSDDYNRIRKFLVDWYASHRTLTSSQKHITDVYSLPANDINELLKSFGFDYGLKLVPLRNRATLFLNIVSLYKKKGTPGALADILSYFGFLDASIVEYWLVKDSLGNLVFRGENIRGETEGGTTLLDEDVTFSVMTSGDPHWMLSYSQIETLISQNKINLPSKTAYFSLSSVFHLNSLEGPIAILSRIVQEEYNRKYINGEDLLQSITIRGLSSIVSVLELHLAVNYVMHIMFGYTETSDANILCFDGTVVYDTATPRSITNIDDMMVQYYNYFNTTKFTRDERSTLLTNYFDDFTRPISSTFIDSTSTVELVLNSISPDFKQELDDWIAQGEQVQLITYLLSALDKYIRTNIDSSIPSLVVTILGFAFQEEVIDIIKFFKPFRARLAFLDTSYAIDNILTESVRLDDLINTTINQSFIDIEDVTEDYVQTIKNYFIDTDVFERIDFKDWDRGGIFDDSIVTNILEVVDIQTNQSYIETIDTTEVIDYKVTQIIPEAKGWQPPTSYDTGSTFDDPIAVQTPIVSDSLELYVFDQVKSTVYIETNASADLEYRPSLSGSIDISTEVIDTGIQYFKYLDSSCSITVDIPDATAIITVSSPAPTVKSLRSLFYEYNPKYIRSIRSIDRISWVDNDISIQLGDHGGGYDDISFGGGVLVDTDYDFSASTWSNLQTVLSPGDEGTYDTNYALMPSVIYDSDDSKYKMIYVGENGIEKRFIYAESVDAVNWTNHQMVLEEGNYTYDDAEITAPTIVKTGSTFYMLYPSFSTIPGYNLRMSFAKSNDLITWTDFSQAFNSTVAFNSVTVPSMITARSSYKGLYIARGTTLGTGVMNYIYISSADAINWTSTLMPYSTTTSYAPNGIIDTGTKLYMYLQNFSAGTTYCVETTK